MEKLNAVYPNNKALLDDVQKLNEKICTKCTNGFNCKFYINKLETYIKLSFLSTAKEVCSTVPYVTKVKIRESLKASIEYHREYFGEAFVSRIQVIIDTINDNRANRVSI